MPETQQVPTVGRIVHYRIGGTDEAPEFRPAIIVRVWSEVGVNLQVLLDGTNDRVGRLPGEVARVPDVGIVWCTSIMRGLGVGQWCWPARS